MTFRTSASQAGSATSHVNRVITIPGGGSAPQVGDIAVVGLYKENTAVVTPAAGFTQKAALTTSGASRGTLYVFWKRLTAADTGSYTFSWTGGCWAGAICGWWSGRATSGDPFDGTVGTAESTTAVTILNVSTSPAAASGDAVGFWTNFSTGITWTAPGSYTNRSATPEIDMATRDNVASGSTGNVTATADASDFEKAFLGVLAAAGGGGSNLTLSPSDSEDLTDAAVFDFAKVVVDAEGLTDFIAFDVSENYSDSEGLTDSIALDVAKPFSDTENLTDSSVLEIGHQVTQSDTEGLTDTASLAFARGVSPADSEGLTDSAFFSVEKVLADPEGLTDTATLAFARAVTAADSEGLTDSAVTELGRLITAADTEGLTDSIATQVSAAYVDTLGLTDSAQVQLSGAGTLDLSDTEGLTDSAAFAFGKVFADALGLTDAAQIDLFRQLSVSAADTETLSDTAVLARAGALAPSDSETITDQTTFAVSWVKTDDAGLSDSVALQMSTIRSYSDVMGLTDSFTIQLGQQVPDRDLELAGYLLPGRFSGTIAPGRFAGSLQPGRLKGEVEW